MPTPLPNLPADPAVITVHDDLSVTRRASSTSTPGQNAAQQNLTNVLDGSPAADHSHSAEVDRVQDAVMAAKSPDGQPPPRWARLLEWKWCAGGAIVLAIAGVILGLRSDVHWPEYIFGGFFVALLLGAAVPAWGAGLLRGREERAARKVALRVTPATRPIH